MTATPEPPVGGDFSAFATELDELEHQLSAWRATATACSGIEWIGGRQKLMPCSSIPVPAPIVSRRTR